MGSSYVDFRGQGFWASDGLLETLLLAIVREIDHRSSDELWLRSVRDDWFIQAIMGCMGCVVPDLDGKLTQEWQVVEVIAVAKSTLSSLRNRNFAKDIEIAEWNGFGLTDTSLNEFLLDMDPIGYENLLILGEHFIELLEGRMTEPRWLYLKRS